MLFYKIDSLAPLRLLSSPKSQEYNTRQIRPLSSLFGIAAPSATDILLCSA